MIKRAAESYLAKLARYYPVVTILGPRQSGKTTLAKEFFKDANYVNLEVASEFHLARSDPEEFLRLYKTPLIIDEVQRVPELLSSIQARVDLNNTRAQYILTGSHQPLLREGISQSLAGRTGIMRLFPLSIAELKSGGFEFDRDEYILNGFYPRLYNEGIPPDMLYLDYYSTYVERDVNQLMRIGDRSKFDLFVRLLAGRVGQLLNLQGMSGDIGVSSQTLSSWLSILEASYVVFRLPCYYENYGKRLLKTPKIYFTDVGLAAALIGLRDVNQVARDPLMGGLFENLVVMEAFKSQVNQGGMPDIYYYRDQHGFEVDLLMRKNARVFPVEIKASRTFDMSMAKSLVKFSEMAGNAYPPALVYAGDLEPTVKGIEFCNFTNFEKLFNSR